MKTKALRQAGITFLVLFTFTFLSSASELFIKIQSQGSYYAMVGLQTHNNNNATFRFFDLNQGVTTLSIYATNTNSLFYSGTVNLEYEERLICEIDNYGNLTVVKKEKVSYSNWYTSTVSNANTGYENNNNYGNGNQDVNFQVFLQLLKNDSFDSGKLDKAKKYIDKTTLSASQITEINNTFSFDASKLDWAKYAYSKCYDKQNYFLLKPSFTFSTSYSDLEDYIEGK